MHCGGEGKQFHKKAISTHYQSQAQEKKRSEGGRWERESEREDRQKDREKERERERNRKRERETHTETTAGTHYGVRVKKAKSWRTLSEKNGTEINERTNEENK